jgi:hypothetical protein
LLEVNENGVYNPVASMTRGAIRAFLRSEKKTSHHLDFNLQKRF